MQSVGTLNLTSVPLIGEKKAALFRKLGIVTVEDLLYFFPRAYADFSDIKHLKDANENKMCVRIKITTDPKTITLKNGKVLTTVSGTDGENILRLSFFGRYSSGNIKKDGSFLLYGNFVPERIGIYSSRNPEVWDDTPENVYFHPVYHCTAGITSRFISACMHRAFDNFSEGLTDNLPPEQLRKYRLPDIKKAIELIHFPKTADDIKQARRRLIYEELLILSLGLCSEKTTGKVASSYKITKDYSAEFSDLLPFRLTSAQKRCITDCINDMASGVAMRRLVQGDVGSGKTAVAASVIYTAVKNGMQAALMAPTEVLAAQHKKTFDMFFKDTGIKTELLTGSTSAKEKKRIKQALADGSADVVIGTHAVITDDVTFAHLGLAVTDEQHRFGVSQRTKLGDKGDTPHILVMSATPIPRTLSLVIYGDLDISILDEKPAGRKEVKTVKIGSDKRKRMFGYIKKELDKGHQAFIVCPLAEEKDEEQAEQNENAQLAIAEKYYKDISENEFRGYPCRLLHGKMKPKQKDEIMKAFSSGEIRLLVCTVVIEVGIDVPNATVMAIENAERFGLSQLHQLRGRCGRGQNESLCILISDAKGEISKKRFDIMCKTNDGFVIAEEDLKLRGPGDFFGNRQSGLPTLRIADLMTDSRVLYAAKTEAERILSADPTLISPQNENLKKEIGKLFNNIN